MPDRPTTKTKLNETEAVIPQGGVAAHDEVTLSERHARMLADALDCCNGSASWQARRETTDLQPFEPRSTRPMRRRWCWS